MTVNWQKKLLPPQGFEVFRGAGGSRENVFMDLSEQKDE